MRASELCRPKPGSFRLLDDGAEGHSYVLARAAYAKNSEREDRITVSAGLVDRIRKHLSTRMPHRPAFDMPCKTAEMIRMDLEAAGIAYESEEGQYDFHALRHQCASFLVAGGVNIKAAQQRMRHSTSKLTLDVYAKHMDGGKDEALAAVSKLA